MVTDAQLRHWDRQARSMKVQIEQLRRTEPMSYEVGMFILTLAHRRLDLIEQMEDVLQAREREAR